MRPPSIPPEFRAWRMSDGYELHGRFWPSDHGKPVGGTLYLHGIQSHGGWFEWSAAQLARSGSPVLLADRRGSGLNQAGRGDTPTMGRWLDDLDELADWLRRECGCARVNVVCVSWGGKLGLAWTLRRPALAARVLLIAPGVFPMIDVGLLARLRVGLALLTRPEREFPIPLDDPALFTDNPAGRTFIAEDPLKLTHATARFLYASVQLDRVVRRAAAGALRAETTLILAGRERIIRNSVTCARLQRLAVHMPTVHTLPDAAHTLEFEPDVAVLGELLQAWAST